MDDPIRKSEKEIKTAISKGWSRRRWRTAPSALPSPSHPFETDLELLHMNLARGLGVIKRFDAKRPIGDLISFDLRPKKVLTLARWKKEGAENLNYFY